MTRKSSCVTARGAPPAVWSVLYPGGRGREGTTVRPAVGGRGGTPRFCPGVPPGEQTENITFPSTSYVAGNKMEPTPPY